MATYDELVNQMSGGRGWAFLTKGQKDQITAQLKSGDSTAIPTPTPTATPTPSIGGGLGSQTPPIAPLGGQTPVTAPSSISSGTGSNLVSFKDTLGKVVELAQQKRNDNMKAFMQTSGFQGTMQASDFNTLFNQMNTMGTQYGETQADKLMPDPSKQYQTVTKEDASGNVVAVTFDPVAGKEISRVNLGKIGTPSTTSNSSPSKLNTAEVQNLLGAGFTQSDITGVESDIALHGIDKVLENPSLTDNQKNALKKVYGVNKQYLTKDWLKSQASEQGLKDAAAAGGFNAGGSWFFGAGVGEQGVSDYLDSQMKKVEDLRKQGFSDDEIWKIL